MTNLLQNAIQHSAAGATIQVCISHRPGGAKVEVSNPSETIAADHLGRLFDRFYRVDASRPNSGENHGLGLAIVKAVARMHRGEVFAQSAQGVTTIGFSVHCE